VAYIWKPAVANGRRLPVIIFNRGGTQEFGQIGTSPIWSPWDRFGFYQFVSSGFVVIASQYRGNDGGEGKEDWGGSDVHDVLNLVRVAQGLPYTDPNNLFLFGVSRGGMMTYLALKAGIAVRAAATIGGATDLVALAKQRPSMVNDVFMDLIPGLTRDNDEPLRERSAVYWPDQIRVPVMILVGASDWRADPLTQGMSLAAKLQQLQSPYELVVYENDDHGLTLHRTESDAAIIRFFRRHMRR